MDQLVLNEDAIYRTSTQYRKWSFSASSLAALRQSTNDTASERVRSLLHAEVETLTVEEELILVKHFSKKAIQLAEHLELPNEISATAVQFIRRFFVMNSFMDYNPQQICISSLFLATKTDNRYYGLQDFARRCNVSQESIVAPEFRLMQGLQFAFDIRHPRRALEAGMVLLDDIFHGRYVSPAGSDPKSFQKKMHSICGSASAKNHRMVKLHGEIRSILRAGAILTDAYFLYTPAQIWIAAMLGTDEEIAQLFIECLLEGTAKSLYDEIMANLKDCAKLICTDEPVNEEERKRVTKKLKQCSNPETADLVGLNAAQKRESSDKQHNIAKKQRVEQGSKEDPFGPSLGVKK